MKSIFPVCLTLYNSRFECFIGANESLARRASDKIQEGSFMRSNELTAIAIFVGLLLVAASILWRSTEFDACFHEAKKLLEEANPDGDSLKIRLRAIQVCQGVAQ
ncbi:hypothetical protein AAFN47_01375 [Hoeflea sp. CAU 1731]